MNGYGVIQHTALTRGRLRAMLRSLRRPEAPPERLIWAAERLTSAAMWLVAHDTYATAVHLDGSPLGLDELKAKPEGHTGSALNICPAYVGYLLANALTGRTRAWIMEQGHAASGIDSVNVLVRNVLPEHAAYQPTDEGLTRFVRDFYSYRVSPRSPRGSHVNANTAGGLAEGGYLGFVGLQYAHMPLPGQSLVAFLSDGAFEEQRGPDWAPRWWRREDCGLVAPIMISNGRRIDQRTTTAMLGGVSWLVRHLRLNHFDPIVFDGRDPAAYAWAVWEMERRLSSSPARYPARLPYGIAVVPKGYGFPGAGTNVAHNLPLGSKPDEALLARFNDAAAGLYVPRRELLEAAALLQRHRGRPRERDNELVRVRPPAPRVPAPPWRRAGANASPMEAVDELFVSIVRANPRLRPRVGNPDELSSNRLSRTLEALKHRVSSPERGSQEALLGGVITALNEEAVACAALANKGGLNLIATYEAFGMKMHGAVRQELIWSAHLAAHGRAPGWLSVPLLLTSHTYENGKNEQSHQDPSLSEALLRELPATSRVLFPPDANAALAAIEAVYQTRGQIWTLVVPKSPVRTLLDASRARQLLRQGWLPLRRDRRPAVELLAVGAFQLGEVLRASRRLDDRGVPHDVLCVQDPRRTPPPSARRVDVTHTRDGLLGFRNVGGTLDVHGMLFVNGQSWAHVLEATGLRRERLLDEEERAALDGRLSPQGVIF